MTTHELTAKAKQELQERDEQTKAGRTYVPDVDIAEDDGTLRLWVDMPGVDKDRVSVDLDDGVLTIHGDVSFEGYDGLSPAYTEYNVGHFSRRFTLRDGSDFDRDRVSAKLVDGVLEIQLPKAERVKPRRIPVTA
jgi:HSP20 family molecular chaperone IbpA